MTEVTRIVQQSLSELFQDADLAQLVMQQIRKDFALQGLGWHDTDTEDVALFVDQLYHRIQAFVRDDFPALLQLLYRIDVSEARVQRELSGSNEDAAVVITRLVLKRELQKVWWKRSFHQGDNP